jgi:hypothetical protein
VIVKGSSGNFGCLVITELYFNYLLYIWSLSILVVLVGLGDKRNKTVDTSNTPIRSAFKTSLPQPQAQSATETRLLVVYEELTKGRFNKC